MREQQRLRSRQASRRQRHCSALLRCLQSRLGPAGQPGAGLLCSWQPCKQLVVNAGTNVKLIACTCGAMVLWTVHARECQEVWLQQAPGLLVTYRSACACKFGARKCSHGSLLPLSLPSAITASGSDVMQLTTTLEATQGKASLKLASAVTKTKPPAASAMMTCTPEPRRCLSPAADKYNKVQSWWQCCNIKRCAMRAAQRTVLEQYYIHVLLTKPSIKPGVRLHAHWLAAAQAAPLVRPCT